MGRPSRTAGRPGAPALFRARYRQLRRTAPDAVERALGLIPVLLHVSLGEKDPPAPGVVGLLHRAALWARWCRAVGLKPPVSRPSGRSLVASVLVLPSYGEDARLYRALAVLSMGASAAERSLVAARLRWIEERLGLSEVLVCTAVLPSELREPLLRARLLLEGAWAGGSELPPALDPGEPAGLDPGQAFEVAAQVDSPELATALVLAAARGRSVAIPEQALRPDPHLGGQAWLASLQPVRERAGLGELLRAGREVSAASVWTARHARPELRRRLAREHRDVGVPVFLLPAVRAALGGRPALDPPRAEPDGRWTVGVHGQVVAAGSTPAQAEVRAEWMLARAADCEPGARSRTRLPEVPKAEGELVLAEVDAPRPHPLPSGDGEGRRRLGRVRVVRRRPHRRPTAIEREDAEAWDLLLRLASEGRQVVVRGVPGDPWVSQLRETLRFWVAAGPPPAVQHQRHVMVPGARRVRHFGVDQVLARPRRLRLDPASPGLWPPGERLPRAMRGIDAWVIGLAEGEAAILYGDERGQWLRDRIATAHVDAYLRDTQDLLRGESGSPLLVHPSSLAPSAPPEGEHILEVRVVGCLPRGLGIDVRGQVYGPGHPGRWEEAASALLSEVPVGAPVWLRCTHVELTSAASGMERLYARSQVLRRLAIHLRHLSGLNDCR